MPHDTHNNLIKWFRDWRQPLRRFIARRSAVSRADIDDVAQEVFLRLLRYDRSTLIADPQAYLFKIAANVAAEWSIRASRRKPHAAEWLTELAADSSPEQELERDVGAEQLHHALLALPPRTREILRLHFGEGLTHEMIAQRLALTRRIVKRELIRAYALLRLTLSVDVLVSDELGCSIDNTSERQA